MQNKFYLCFKCKNIILIIGVEKKKLGKKCYTFLISYSFIRHLA